MYDPDTLDTAALVALVVTRFSSCQPHAAVPRDDFYAIARKMLGRNPRAKAEIDAVVAPLVELGLLVIGEKEELARRAPVVRGSVPATVTRTYYRLTAAGLGARAFATAVVR